jgi:Holliday junction resolvase RusA-like endonuclease
MSGGTVFISSAVITGGKLRGEPPTQGDHFTDPRTGRFIDQKDARIRVWRRLIFTGLQTSGWQPIEHGPVRCTLDFILPRPKEHYRTGQFANLLRKAAPLWHRSKPDLDKLTRAVLDALTKSHAIGDDAQISMLIASKRYTTGGEVGVRITCEPLPSDIEEAQP